MTKIKFCGLSRICDAEAANELMPSYAGFVFAEGSRRMITPETAVLLRAALDPAIPAVGVFVDEDIRTIARLLNAGTIDLAQLHGHEDDIYIDSLRTLTDRPVIQAFRVKTSRDAAMAERSRADYILLDAGAGKGEVFDWSLVREIRRPFFLAGGLTPDNVEEAVAALHPFAVDVSSGIETDGVKDREKMRAFAAAVRGRTKR